MEALLKQLDTLVTESKEAEDEMTEQGMDPFVSGGQVVRFFNGNA